METNNGDSVRDERLKQLAENENSILLLQDEVDKCVVQFLSLTLNSSDRDKITNISNQLERLVEFRNIEAKKPQTKSTHRNILIKIDDYLQTNDRQNNAHPVPTNIPFSLRTYLEYTQNEEKQARYHLRTEKPQDLNEVKSKYDHTLASLYEIHNRRDCMCSATGRIIRTDVERSLREEYIKLSIVLQDKNDPKPATVSKKSKNSNQSDQNKFQSPAERMVTHFWTVQNNTMTLNATRAEHVEEMVEYLKKHHYQCRRKELDIIITMKSDEDQDTLFNVWENITQVNLSGNKPVNDNGSPVKKLKKT